jgi:hypothetical protein
MEIKLDIETIKGLVSESIMTSLTDEKRDTLIQGALTYLLTKVKHPYGNRTESPVEGAFNSALEKIAQEMATEALEKDTRVRETIRKMISDAAERLLDEKGYNETVERIKNAIAQGLSPR